MKDDFSKYLRLAAEGEIVITRHGRPAGVLIGFASEEDWLITGSSIIPSFYVVLLMHEPRFGEVGGYPWKRFERPASRIEFDGCRRHAIATGPAPLGGVVNRAHPV